jgi:hypothetical protein
LSWVRLSDRKQRSITSSALYSCRISAVIVSSLVWTTHLPSEALGLADRRPVDLDLAPW